MVGGTPKPFACTSEGCTMTFTNEDHLNVHQKKHEMVLNLGVKNTTIVADQTPTPTRFLRNCEEVGLFQDLQNVNPFEETFRRATEMAKTGSLPIPDLPEDDTLHTPHVFPHIPEENVSSIYNSQKTDKITENIDTTTESVNIKDKIDTKLSLSPDHMYALTINTDKNISDLNNDKSDIKSNLSKKPLNIRSKKLKCEDDIAAKPNSTILKLQQILQSKQMKNERKHNVTQPIIVVQGLKIANSEKLLQSTVVNNMVPVLQTPVHSQNNLDQINDNSTSDESGESNKKKKLDLLARNRAAATRCRAKKKMWISSLENRYNNVCKEKDTLEKEVHNLKNEIVYLKNLLLAHKDCPVTKAMNMGQNIPIGPPRLVTTVQVPAIRGKIESDSLNVTTANRNLKAEPNFVNHTKTSVIVLNDSLIN